MTLVKLLGDTAWQFSDDRQTPKQKSVERSWECKDLRTVFQTWKDLKGPPSSKLVSNGPEAKLSLPHICFVCLPHIFVNKALLEHSHTHSCTDYQCWFHPVTTELGSCNTDYMACKAQTNWFPWPCTKSQWTPDILSGQSWKLRPRDEM